jgi:nitrogen fixation protein FixH
MTGSCLYRTRRPPTEEEIAAALGAKLPVWMRLTRFVETTYSAEGTWTTWGQAKSGWNLRYRRNGRALVALHPQRDRIYVEMVLGHAEADRALALNLTDAATKALHAAPQGRDGRWIYLAVASAADAEDVEKLLVAKVRPPRAKERG